MVEGSRIDWEAYGNDVFRVLKEIVEFDGAVKVALGFVDKHPIGLLVILMKRLKEREIVKKYFDVESMDEEINYNLRG